MAGVGHGGGSLGVGSGEGTVVTTGSCVATGVGSWTGVDAGVSSDADGVGVGAEGAPGLRRAALGANFLPVVFSSHGLAKSVPCFGHGATHC